MKAPKKFQNTILRYSMKEEALVGTAKNEKKNYDMMTVVQIFLGQEDSEAYSGVLKMLEVLLSDDRTSEEKKHILSRDFDIEFSVSMEKEVMEMCNLSSLIENRGIEKGIEKGMLNSIQSLMRTTGGALKR